MHHKPHFTTLLITLSAMLLALLHTAPLNAQCCEFSVKQKLLVGAARYDKYKSLVEGKRVAIIGNHTSRVDDDGTLLPEFLLGKGVKVVKLFSPEHGFRGEADAGEAVSSNKDSKTGLPIVSLYGAKKKPSKKDLENVDVILFDLQDVGTRFYTYISTMHYGMEAAAESNIPFIVLDRPNPNDYVDGPVRDDDCQSFISMHKIPLLHGLTVGELALMINGEKWLNTKNRACNLTVVPVQGWKHGDEYILPVAPSPNLRSKDAVTLYPSLCLFEATIMSVGRGTSDPFTVLGYPNKQFGSYSFVPQPGRGDKNPKYKGQRCYGENFAKTVPEGGLNISILLRYYKLAKHLGFNLIDRSRTFALLAGTKKLQQQLENGATEEEIRASWQKGLNAYKLLRNRYIIYK